MSNKKKGLSMLLSLVLLLTALPAGQMTALAADLTTEQNVKYLDANGEEQTCPQATVVTSSGLSWGAAGQETWYVVNGNVAVFGGGFVVNGHVNLILKDGVELRAVGTGGIPGIQVSGADNSFTVYAQSTDANKMGKLYTLGGNAGTAAIGGHASGTIGNRTFWPGENITINGGNITATGKSGGAGIGGAMYKEGKNITINGGIVNATGDYGAGIGGGGNGSASYIYINGGTVTATGNESAAGIGGGYKYEANVGNADHIYINGGKVTAKAGQAGVAAIGAGLDGAVSDIYVSDDVVLKAGTSEDPTEEIAHASDTTDVSASLAGKQYATAVWEPREKPEPEEEEENPEIEEEPKPVYVGTPEKPVTDGIWNMGPGGAWTFRTNGLFRNTWGYIRLEDGRAGWFWFDKYGVMQTGWKLINGKWYYFNEVHDGTYGMMLFNTTTPDGYRVGADGALIQ